MYPIEPKKESSTDAIPLVMRVLKLVKKISDMICKSLMDLIYSSNVNLSLISHKLYTHRPLHWCILDLVHIRMKKGQLKPLQPKICIKCHQSFIVGAKSNYYRIIHGKWFLGSLNKLSQYYKKVFSLRST